MKDFAQTAGAMGFSPQRLVEAMHQGGVALWAWDPVRGTAWLDDLAQRFWGIACGEVPLDTLWDRIHPEDRAEARAAWRQSARATGPYEFAFRITGDRPRWISARGVGGETGVAGDRVLAIFVDVTEEKERQALLDRMVGEMGHRIGNLFSVASAVAGFARKATDDPDEMVADLRRRFSELSGVFRFIAKRQAAGADTVPLAGLITHLMAPYEGADGTVEITVPEALHIGATDVVSLSMVFHELATNALKYGALALGGRVVIAGAGTAEGIALSWAETGGVRPDFGTGGFGTRMIDATVTHGLRGAVAREISDDGFVLRLTLPSAARA